MRNRERRRESGPVASPYWLHPGMTHKPSQRERGGREGGRERRKGGRGRCTGPEVEVTGAFFAESFSEQLY